MQPEIVTITPKILVGFRTIMSFGQNKTAELWQNFMPKKHLINFTNSNLFSVEVYPDLNFFKALDSSAKFEKWASIEVASTESLPKEMEVLKIPKGLYAKFQYQGKVSEAATFYALIFNQWLPTSNFVLSNRPHFAVMDENYKGEHPDSKEEIYIPVENSA